MKRKDKLPLKLPNEFASQIYYHYEPGDKEAEGDTLLRIYGAGLAMKNGANLAKYSILFVLFLLTLKVLGLY